MGDGYQIEGKSALVTGAGRGMGRAVAEALARNGANVVVADINRPNADAVAATIRAVGGTAEAVTVDIGKVASIRAAFAEIDRIAPPLDIVVLAAAILRVKPFLDHDEEDWDALADVNLKGTFFSLQEAARRMVARKAGSIVTFASTSAFVASRVPEIAYDVTKGGIRQMTVSAAVELAPHRVRVNAVAPGTILTDFNRATLEAPEARAAAERGLPLGRVGMPEDIVGAALYLASPISSYVTGQLLVVDGGRLGRAG